MPTMGYITADGFFYDLLTPDGEFNYRVDVNFTTMEQVKGSTRKTRRIRRLVVNS